MSELVKIAVAPALVLAVVVTMLTVVTERTNERVARCVAAGGHEVQIYRDRLCVKDGRILEVQ